MPVIHAIYGSLEVEVETDPDSLSRFNSLETFGIEKEFGGAKHFHAIKLISVWLEGSDFEVKNYRFFKKKEKAKWKDFLKILKSKIAEHRINQDVIVLSLSKSGKMVRDVDGHKLNHEFEKGSLKYKIIFLLHGHGDFMETDDITKIVGSKSKLSINDTISKINRSLKADLQLPAGHNFIEGKRPTYRINPLYNLVIVK
jgi:hypothetical protein